jgi:hypothetical protein
MQQKPGENIGVNPGPGPGMGQPVVRKMALDLNGLAGFAILAQDGDSGDAALGMTSGDIGTAGGAAGGRQQCVC